MPAGIKGGGSPDITPPFECGISTHRSDGEGWVTEWEGVEGGRGDVAGLSWVFPVELCNGIGGKDIGVLNPFIM